MLFIRSARCAYSVSVYEIHVTQKGWDNVSAVLILEICIVYCKTEHIAKKCIQI